MEISDQLKKCRNDKHLQKILYKIRTQHMRSKEDIEKLNLSYLVNLFGERIQHETSEENDKIIEILLSILGNCTYSSKKGAFQAFEANIIEHVIALLNKSDNEVIKAKNCRLIGNLSQHEKIALKLQQSNVALCLSNCLSDETSSFLITMAVRSIRLMWNSKKFRFEMLSYGTIVKITSCLNKALKSESKSDDDDDDDDNSCNNQMVILKRTHEPDRFISKEKLSNIIEKMEKHDVKIDYEILKPERRKKREFTLPATKETNELVSGILKSLLTISATQQLPQVARSIITGISCLLYLIEESIEFRSMCLKILSNLSYNAFAQEYLCINNELIPTICNLMMNSESLSKPLEQNEQKYCLDILCLSSENACNRLKLRRSGVFKTMLSIANTTKKQNELNLLIFAFFQFRYDEDGLNSLIQLNLINVLIKILADIIENKQVDHIKVDHPSLDEERKEEQKLKQQQQKKRFNTEPLSSFNCINKFMRYDSASPSNNNYGYRSPQSSSGYSPYNSPVRCYNDYDSDSNQYSPVCSDNEDNNDSKKKDFDILEYIYNNDEIGKCDEQKKAIEDDDNSMTMNDVESNNDNEEEDDTSSNSKKSDNIPETLKSIESDQMQFILLLLWKVSIKHSDNTAFVRTSNLSTLIQVCKLVQRPNGKIYQILSNILEQTRNFVQIMLRQDLVFQIYKLSYTIYDHLDCYSCNKMKMISKELLRDLSKVSETGYGIGEITHCLLTDDDDEVKKKIACKLLYVISSSETLNQFLFKYHALDMILNIIFSNTNLSEEACNGITTMSNNLNIKIPSEDDVFSRIIPDDYCEDQNLFKTDNELVKFVLKDGEISLDKETLKNCSEVFNSMLTGSFRESNCNEVKFPNYSVAGMKYFYQILKMQLNGKLKPIAPKINDMDVILQAYELSILYILVNIQQPLLNVIKIVLDETSVMKIFKWALKNIDQDLLISSICYYLCAQIDGTTKLKIYLEAYHSEYSNEWKNLIIDSILMKCRPLDD